MATVRAAVHCVCRTGSSPHATVLWAVLQRRGGRAKRVRAVECGPSSPVCLQGELSGQKGLVPSNFLEEVPDDVEVYLSDAPSPHARDAPARAKAKRVSSRPQRVSRPCHCHLRSHAVCCPLRAPSARPPGPSPRALASRAHVAHTAALLVPADPPPSTGGLPRGRRALGLRGAGCPSVGARQQGGSPAGVPVRPAAVRAPCWLLCRPDGIHV